MTLVRFSELICAVFGHRPVVRWVYNRESQVGQGAVSCKRCLKPLEL